MLKDKEEKKWHVIVKRTTSQFYNRQKSHWDTGVISSEMVVIVVVIVEVA